MSSDFRDNVNIIPQSIGFVKGFFEKIEIFMKIRFVLSVSPELYGINIEGRCRTVVFCAFSNPTP